MAWIGLLSAGFKELYKPGLKGIYLNISAFMVPLLFLALLPFSLEAGEGKGGESLQKADPTRISSDLMETESGSKTVIFKGNVVVTRGDLTMNSDQLRIINFQESGKMEKMIATGNVRLRYKGRMAYAEQAIYYYEEDKLELLGTPRAVEGDNEISGEVMLLFLRENRTIVKGSRDARVNVVYYPREK